jgi:hypothetical protein
MMGRITKGALVGLLFVLAAGVWPAHAAVSNVKVTNPTQNEVLSGAYSNDGTASGFGVPLRGSASTGCSGFSSISFKVTGPNSYSKTFNVGSHSGQNYSGGPSTPWDTQDLRNGLYTVRIDVTDTGGVLCNSQSGSAYVTAKLANPPQAPVWNGSPSAASDGSAHVTLSWKQNGEPDIVEYAIFRDGPDGTKKAVVSATTPGSSGCSLSNGSYTCVDPASNFPSSYDGTYSYAIVALRSRPDYNSGETVKNCDTTDKPCVASDGSDVRQVSLTAPTPSPSPTDSPSPGSGGSPTPGHGGGGGVSTTGGSSSSSSGKKGGTSVLSFGTSRGGSSYNDFYSGTYSENLPYQPKTLIVGGGGKATPGGEQVQAAAVNNTPPNYRTVMLPVAGGLLAFLSAAHVRRLLLHF